MMKKIIIGKINASETTGYWQIGDNYTPDVIPGDYAIVENKNGYDLVKIIGIVETTTELENNLYGNKITKKAIGYHAKNFIERENKKLLF